MSRRWKCSLGTILLVCRGSHTRFPKKKTCVLGKRVWEPRHTKTLAAFKLFKKLRYGQCYRFLQKEREGLGKSTDPGSPWSVPGPEKTHTWRQVILSYCVLSDPSETGQELDTPRKPSHVRKI
ncbi:hypothetical protein Bbelb_362820 [Branchiostoma belcheri]|nr:hypothetical protein Bbelb_362820 [Branchiostoma belcheri]